MKSWMTTTPVERAPAPRRWGPEYLFAALLGVFGVTFAFAIPPVQTPDEPSHLHRAYQVSEGTLTTFPVGEWGGGEVPDSVLRIAERFGFLFFHTERQTGWQPFAELLRTPLEPERRQAVPLPGSAYYSFVPYVPQALGIALARVLGAGPLGLLYAGRLMNLAFAVFLVFWAIRLTPIGKLVMGTVVLLPITVQQLASNSPDALTIGLSFVMVACFLRAVMGQGVLRFAALAGLFAIASAVTLCKFPYAALALLYFAIPWQRLGSPRRYFLIGGSLMVMIVGLAWGLTQLRANIPDRLVPDGRGVSISKQTRFIQRHPLRYTRILTSTAAEHGKIWIDQLSMLGWLDTQVNPFTMHLYLIFMVLVALGDRAGGDLTMRLRILGLVASALCGSVIVTSCYVSGCTLHAPLIVGPQGRYFIPFLTLLLLPLRNDLLRVRVNRRVLRTLTGAACTTVLLVTLATIIRRYYVTPTRQGLVMVIALTLAFSLFAIVAYRLHRSVQAPALQPAPRLRRRRLLERAR